jgi:hypothetical protein
VEQAHRAAAAAEADRDAAIHRARAEADRRVAAAEADRDQARQLADGAAGQARQAQQEAARAQAAGQAAQVETERARADAERMVAEFRAEAARERDEMRAGLRARAERAEHEADTYRAELARVRESTAQVSVLTNYQLLWL